MQTADMSGDTSAPLLDNNQTNLVIEVPLERLNNSNGTGKKEVISTLNSPNSDGDTIDPELVKQLFDLLREKRTDEFIQEIQNNADAVNAFNDIYTLLQAAVWFGLEDVVKKLVEMGADVNKTGARANKKTGEKRSSAILAAHKGYDRILEVLLKNEETDLSVVDNEFNKFTALHVTVVFPTSNTRCFELLLKYGESAKHKLNINAQDNRYNTALHYAAEKNQLENVLLLLQHNANIFISNDEDDPAFIHIDPKCLNDHLDKHINIIDKRNMGNIPASSDGGKFFIQFDYGLLASLEDNNSFAPEMDSLVKLADSPNHRSLFNHPLIKSFLHLKWYRIYWFFYINFVIYTLFTIFFSLHVYFLVTPVNATSEDSPTEVADSVRTRRTMENLCWWLTFVLMICLVVREIIEILMACCQYVRHLENWLEWALLVLTAFLLSPCCKSYVHATSAVAILLAYTELVLLIGRHPSLATYIAMFIQVSRNFICFLLWYSILIVAFGFSFYILFQHCDSQEDCKNNLFLNLGTSLFKTIIMLTGELEATDLEFQSISITSHIIFLLFIFFIAIVLINLLNGLAISDIQVIRQEAEIVCCVAQVKLYATMESTLLYGRITRVRDWFGKNILLLSVLLPKSKLRVYLNEWNKMDPDIRNSCWRGCTDCATGNDRSIFFLQNTCVRKSCRWCLVFNTIVSDARDVVVQRDSMNDTTHILTRLDELEKMLKEVLDSRKNNNTEGNL